jgi:hypothetical protein
MCAACTDEGLEVQCPACHPPRSPEWRELLRVQAVKKAAFVRCAACGTTDERFDAVGKPLTGHLVLVVGLGLLLWYFFTLTGVFAPRAARVLLSTEAAVVLLLALRGFRAPACASCLGSAELWPAVTPPALPTPTPVRQRAEALAAAQWWSRRRSGLAWVIGSRALFAVLSFGSGLMR